MPRYFVDTWYFIAFVHRGDPHHRVARALSRKLEGAEFFTHDGVLTELLTFFARLMLRVGLTHALTNDHHFRQEGFTVVNE